MLKFGPIIFFATITAFIGTPAHPWDGHFMITYAALSEWPLVIEEPLVRSETLESFVRAEHRSLVLLLRRYEAWAQKHIKSYPVLPKELSFNTDVKPGESLVQKFLMSLRLNPELTYPNFVLYPPGEPHRIVNSFTGEELKSLPLSSLSAFKVDEPILEAIRPGQAVSALEILAAGSEEADHGLDIGLWEDSDTWYGPLMGMGPQPFGNDTVHISSQAPLHMGYFHEPAYVYAAVVWLKRCFPEYRISLFMTLSRHAMATGHPYWGYRFLGWALHYIQDLSQPYHAKMAPGADWLELFLLQLLEKNGIRDPIQQMRQLLTNRHIALENYGFASLKGIQKNDALAKSLSEISKDERYPVFDSGYPRAVVAREGYDQAEVTNDLLLDAMPWRYVHDPNFILDHDTDVNLRELVFRKNQKTAQTLEAQLLMLMSAVGSHTRKAVEYIMQPSAMLAYKIQPLLAPRSENEKGQLPNFPVARFAHSPETSFESVFGTACDPGVGFWLYDLPFYARSRHGRHARAFMQPIATKNEREENISESGRDFVNDWPHFVSDNSCFYFCISRHQARSNNCSSAFK